VIFLSSVAVYGERQEAVDEETSPFPSTAYGMSKLLAEKPYISDIKRIQKDAASS
jgi:nucleoside-diphosphate-sugar epimerase